MDKIVFMFSGQGSQYAGMGAELCSGFPEAARVYEQASDILGFDVLRLSKEGSKEELARTAVSQPLIYTLSTAACAVLKAGGVRPDAAAGFSLGECSALAAAGAMTPETGFKVIRARSQAMQRAAESSNGAMYAVIGPDAAEVDEACRETEGYVTPVNFNCPGQIVIAGGAEAAQKAAETLHAGGARVVKLTVNAAFHSKLMESAAREFYEEIKGEPFAAPKLPLYSNVTGDAMETGDIPAYLRTQMTSPVRFSDELLALHRDGFTDFVELGPGKTLCGFVRKTLKGARFRNVEDKKSADGCLAALRPAHTDS